ncbi:MAG: hypothetical protein Q9167_006293 [Letrouitia subvulpina]
MASAIERDDVSHTRTLFQPHSVVKYLVFDTFGRIQRVSRSIPTRLLYSLSLVPSVSAQESSQTRNADCGNESIVPMAELVFHFSAWRKQAKDIRKGTDRLQCLQNLGQVLANVCPLRAAENAGSAGALTLLPTAGALIGMPTKELWVVYKLMPLAGVLSMLLSLGGTMIPSQASEYEIKASGFSYGGLMATTKEEEKEDFPESKLDERTEPEKFASKVEQRSKDIRGGRKYIRVWYGIFIQIGWVSLLVFACWFASSGSVIPWWCTENASWMLFWYSMVAISSILENIAGVPFTQQWTLRVSRAPKLRISDDAPSVRFLERPVSRTVFPRRLSSSTNPPSYPTTQVDEEDFSFAKPFTRPSTDVLDALEVGLNCKGQVIMDNQEPWSASRVPFYVIISLEGISSSHAGLRVVSKAFSVACFAAGTLIFASAQFVTISVSLTVIFVVLSAGVFGRVVAMWMASEMIRTRPILHRVVKSRAEAAYYVDHIMALDGLTVEVLGHVIVNGRCIKRYNKWLRLATWFGILAEPYDVTKLAVSF